MDNDDLHKIQKWQSGKNQPGNQSNVPTNGAKQTGGESSKEDFAKELDLVRNANKRIKRGRRSVDTIDNVLNKLVSSMGLDRRLKEHALLGLWPMMIGDMFAQRSRPLFIDHEGNLVIAAKDASTAQELSLLKPEIIKKMRYAAQSMGLKVNGVRFDLKHYHGGTPSVADGDRFEAHKQHQRAEPTPEELAEITLSQDDLQELADLKATLPPENSSDKDVLKDFKLHDGESMCVKMPSASSQNAKKSAATGGKQFDLNQRIFSMFEQELKLRQWRRRQGFPICRKCNQSTQTLHGADSVCPDCYFATLSHARDI